MSEQPVSGIPQWNVGDRLRKSLSFAGMKVGEMAEFLGVERNTVGNYMSGRTHIPGPALRLWAMRTGVRMEWIVTGAEEPPGEGPEGSGLPRLDSNQQPAEYTFSLVAA